MGNSWKLTVAELSYFSTATTFADNNFVDEDLMQTFCSDVGYDFSYGDKKSDRYHMTKVLNGKEIKSHGLEFVLKTSHPIDLMDRLILLQLVKKTEMIPGMRMVN